MARFSVIQFIREQWTTLPVCSADVSSKAIMLIGSNVGIGLEAAIHFAGMKPKLVMATCRDEKKCQRTRDGKWATYSGPRGATREVYML